MNTSTKASVVIGTQYGDEGKARVVDDMAKDFDIVARFNGGANAGHTVENHGQKVALKQVPSGIFYEDKILYVGSGCVVNIAKIQQELSDLADIGIDVSDRLHLSSQAAVIQPHHVLLDTMIGGKIGTTRNGIGPAYSAKALRMWGDKILNIRLGDLVEDSERYFKAMSDNLQFFAEMYQIDANLVQGNLEELKQSFDQIGKYVELDTLFLQKKVQNEDKRVLFEGAQSFMLDVSKGSVPYVTSSGTSAPSAYVGGDLSPDSHGTTIGVAKAIMSRVGHGPFISEFARGESEEYCMAQNEDGSPTYGRAVESALDIEALLASENEMDMSKAVRSLSGEYGTVTTRPRRVGALDLVQLRYAARTNGVDGLVLTKCDLLNIFSRTAKGTIPLVTGYELDGQPIDYVPGSTDTYARVQPIIEHRPAFTEDISDARSESELPTQLKEVLAEVEEKVGCKVVGIGVGPARDQYVKLN